MLRCRWSSNPQTRMHHTSMPRVTWMDTLRRYRATLVIRMLRTHTRATSPPTTSSSPIGQEPRTRKQQLSLFLLLDLPSFSLRRLIQPGGAIIISSTSRDLRHPLCCTRTTI
ncbi:hypothetical protein EXIGLDRAFT_151609 [Exidia glandulosa HHB12029]|uniref:Uncharacterized protein n=1 Tax=Exidia glandulosa HHB12029 TaxID=1314781 RepID=A0A165QD18_EXIGL|nr:hypothetical protein EXIGLDRAFT_151609 [Exidia glandulosa HHB12029]